MYCKYSSLFYKIYRHNTFMYPSFDIEKKINCACIRGLNASKIIIEIFLLQVVQLGFAGTFVIPYSTHPMLTCLSNELLSPMELTSEIKSSLVASWSRRMPTSEAWCVQRLVVGGERPQSMAEFVCQPSFGLQLSCTTMVGT